MNNRINNYINPKFSNRESRTLSDYGVVCGLSKFNRGPTFWSHCTSELIQNDTEDNNDEELSDINEAEIQSRFSLNRISSFNQTLPSLMNEDPTLNIEISLNKSIKFRRPSNHTSGDFDNNHELKTNWDSMNSDNEDHSHEAANCNTQLSEEEYELLTQKVSRLVRDSKNLKTRGFISDILLKEKLYTTFLAKKGTIKNDDFLFIESTLAASKSIKNFKSDFKYSKKLVCGRLSKRSKSRLSISKMSTLSSNWLTKLH